MKKSGKMRPYGQRRSEKERLGKERRGWKHLEKWSWYYNIREQG